MNNFEALAVIAGIALYLFCLIANWREMGGAERTIFLGMGALVFLLGFDIIPGSNR